MRLRRRRRLRDRSVRGGVSTGPLAKARAVDAAIANASRCVEILGAYGVSRDYGAGRYLNDARVGYACEF